MKYLNADGKVSENQALKILDFCGTCIQLLKRTCTNLKDGEDLDGLFTGWHLLTCVPS